MRTPRTPPSIHSCPLHHPGCWRKRAVSSAVVQTPFIPAVGQCGGRDAAMPTCAGRSRLPFVTSYDAARSATSEGAMAPRPARDHPSQSPLSSSPTRLWTAQNHAENPSSLPDRQILELRSPSCRPGMHSQPATACVSPALSGHAPWRKSNDKDESTIATPTMTIHNETDRRTAAAMRQKRWCTLSWLSSLQHAPCVRPSPRSAV
jgi:hypothetical protein